MLTQLKINSMILNDQVICAKCRILEVLELKLNIK